MIVLVLGGAGSGKSEIAENICMNLNKGNMAYIATMKCYDTEGYQRVEKHRSLRKSKGFETIERYIDISNIEGDFDTVIVECVSNLTANVMYDANDIEDCVQFIVESIKLLAHKVNNVVIVSNDVFCDGIDYDKSIMKYIQNISKINSLISELSDKVVEVVCGIPITRKGN